MSFAACLGLVPFVLFAAAVVISVLCAIVELFVRAILPRSWHCRFGVHSWRASGNFMHRCRRCGKNEATLHD